MSFSFSTRRTEQMNRPEWKSIRGKIISKRDPMRIFRGDEILKVYAIDASRTDVTCIFLGSQKIRLRSGQTFPIRFEFFYDQSRATSSQAELSMQASIVNLNGVLLYANDTQTSLINNVKIDLKPEKMTRRNMLF